jgi:trans-aconitate 2-methyltransferase
MRQVEDGWVPSQYERFKAERTQPFYDLLSLVRPVPGGRVVDLGCGTGELTAELHAAVGAAVTLGIDNSDVMLAEAAAFATDAVTFEAGDVGAFGGERRYDIVFANASLQWVPDHERVLTQWAGALRPGGQLAVQVPANVDHPSHTVSAEVATEEPFLSALGGAPPPDPVRSVLPPAQYAELLHRLAFVDQHVRLQVYGHVLDSTADVVEWTKGTSLTRFRRLLPAELFDAFVDRYRARLLEVLGDHAPYFYAFKRVLMWGRLA